MANKRMFSLDVVDTDKFLELPASSQSLYFHLGIRADSKGIVRAPRAISRSLGHSEYDLQILISKSYLRELDNGVIEVLF